MITLEKIESHLVAEEGEVLHAYTDHLGYLTIGVGRLIDKRRAGASRARSRVTYCETTSRGSLQNCAAAFRGFTCSMTCGRACSCVWRFSSVSTASRTSRK